MGRLNWSIAVCLVFSLMAARAFGIQPGLCRPVALVLSSDGKTLFTANRDSGSISIVDTLNSSLTQTIDVGGRPGDLAIWDETHLLVLDAGNHQLLMLTQGDRGWQIETRMDVASDPVRLLCDRAARRCYVSSLWSRVVSVVNIETLENTKNTSLHLVKSLPLSFEAREMCLAHNGRNLIVASSFKAVLSLIDTASLTTVASHRLPGHNIRGLAIDEHDRLLITQQDLNPLARSTHDDVHWGNMLANLLVSLPMDELEAPTPRVSKNRRVMQLGEPDHAAGDPGQIVIGPKGQRIVLLGGVNEVAILANGSDSQLQRVAVNKHPVSAALHADRLYVAEMFSDSVSVIDLVESRVVDRIRLGPDVPCSPAELGESLFYDARLSLEGWMSCHSCHTDGHTSEQLNDNFSDGGFDTPKRVLSLLGVGETSPWAWNGQVQQLEEQVVSSVQNTMQGQPLSSVHVDALVAYLSQLPPPPPTSQPVSAEQQVEIQSGQTLFRSLGCQACHPAPTYTTPRSYDVGLADTTGDAAFNPPSLRGVGRRHAFFHDARASSLTEVLQSYQHQLSRELTERELRVLLKFLESI